VRVGVTDEHGRYFETSGQAIAQKHGKKHLTAGGGGCGGDGGWGWCWPGWW